MTFRDLNLNTPLYNALDDLGYTTPTPIQAEAFNVVASGKDIVGIAQTGTGKTFAYMLPVLRNLPFSNTQEQNNNVCFLPLVTINTTYVNISIQTLQVRTLSFVCDGTGGTGWTGWTGRTEAFFVL